MNTKLDLSSRAFAIALIALVVVASGAAWFLVVAPKRSEATKLQTTIQSKESELADAQRQQAAPVSNVPLTTLDAAMPTSPAVPQVVDELNKMAAQSGTVLDTVTPGAPVLGNGYTTLPLTVVVDGHYFAVQKFLQLVRTRVKLDKKTTVDASGRLFDVEGVALEQTEPAPKVSATLTMSAFYFTGAAAPTPTVDTTDTTTTSTG